ncbi:unnamed protein product [Blepharisma stoltei]|uniref:Spindle assembly abnormal protein 6 N-terminal domain-containing protein n=1 Tax=Blepharisma stoltei TaxID=1481888 RepID=A0AAU9JME0_9CILI|nr:unnamed protein product [Blepharisma stoltei]
MMIRQPSNTSFRANSTSELRSFEPFEPVTEKVLVQIKGPGLEEKSCFLDIHIAMTQVQNSHHQVLNIEITDEADPFFLYATEIGEQEFHTIKHEQQLLIDFLMFPHNVLDLIRRVSRTFDENPKFSCSITRVNSHEATFSISEINYMRSLSHITLRFRGANDELIKAHLASRVKEYKACSEELQAKLNSTEEMLELKSAQFNDISRQFQTIKIENERKLEERRLEDQEKLTTVRQQMLDTQLSMQNQFDYERRVLEEKYQKTIQELNEKLEAHQNRLNEVLGNKTSLEGTERELSARVNKLDHELELASNELALLRTNNKSLETTKFDQEKAITEYRIKLENLQRQLQDKEELNQKLQSFIETNNEFKSQQDDTIGLLKASVAKMEDKLAQSASEINKGNSIIQKLQSEIKSGKQKLKLKNTVVMQQENVIQQKQDQIDMQEKEIFQLRRDIGNKEDELKRVQDENLQLKKKVEESKQNLGTMQETLNWLNGKVNDFERSKLPYTSTYKVSSTPGVFKPSGYDPNLGTTSPFKPTYQMETNPVTTSPYKPSYQIDSSTPSAFKPTGYQLESNTPSSFKPSSYAVESFRTTTPRVPLGSNTVISSNILPDSDVLPSFKEPIKYKEPR